MNLQELKKIGPEKLSPLRVEQLISNYEKAVEALKKIANEDFRGNRPQSAVDAYKTLKELGEI